MNPRSLFFAVPLTLAMAGGANAAEDDVVVRAYDGPPEASSLAESLSGVCEGLKTELRFVRAEPGHHGGRLELFVEGRKVADLSDTPLGRDWTKRSRILNKGMRCSSRFIRMVAVGVEIQGDGTGRLIYSEASLNDGKVTYYQPPHEQDADYWRDFGR